MNFYPLHWFSFCTIPTGSFCRIKTGCFITNAATYWSTPSVVLDGTSRRLRLRCSHGHRCRLHWHIWEPKLAELELDRLVDFMQTLTDESFTPATPTQVKR